MTNEEAMKTIPCGRYRHFKGNEYEVIGIARHRRFLNPTRAWCAWVGLVLIEE